MATGAMGGAAQARNLDYYLQRMSGYSKNTIKIQPQSKETYYAGDTVIWRLPTNSIIDLHTLTLKFAGQLLYTGPATAATDPNTIKTATAVASWPRNTASVLRRCDWTMGGMQVGLGSLHDYGFLNNLLTHHKIPVGRAQLDLSITDNGGQLTEANNSTASSTNVTGSGNTGVSPSVYMLPGGGQWSAQVTTSPTARSPSQFRPMSISNWLGLPSGNFMRFLDTNILPDIEIRMLLAPNSILCTDKAGSVQYRLSQLSFSCESISFGDGSYRAMVDSRMASGEPLLVPFYSESLLPEMHCSYTLDLCCSVITLRMHIMLSWYALTV